MQDNVKYSYALEGRRQAKFNQEAFLHSLLAFT